MKFIPDTFKVPERYQIDDLLFRKLCLSDAVEDYEAVMSSIDIIKQTRGGTSWPDEKMTLYENQVDLGWHQHEFENRSTFAYVIYTADESEYIGCLYLYPPGHRNEKSADADVDVSFWVTQAAYDQGYYEKVYTAIDSWLKADWPFEKLGYSNKAIPN